MELEDGGENSEINPYQENSFFFVGVISPSRAVKGELQHPVELCQPRETKSIVGPKVVNRRRSVCPADSAISEAADRSASSIDNRQSSVYHRYQIEGRMSSMVKQAQQRVGVLQGTLDMLILRTLLYGPAHGHQIGKHIQRTTNEFLQMQHGSLYPALHRLEQRGWVVSRWETAPDRNREFKYYRLTDKGRKQLVVEESQWKQMAEAVSRVMWPAAEEN